MADQPHREETAAVQAERDLIAQSLHDTVCQTLGGAYLQIALIVRKLQAGQTPTLEEAILVRDTVHSAVGELHQLMHSLGQSALPDSTGSTAEIGASKAE